MINLLAPFVSLPVDVIKLMYVLYPLSSTLRGTDRHSILSGVPFIKFNKGLASGIAL
jgi:hypothetical protein